MQRLFQEKEGAACGAPTNSPNLVPLQDSRRTFLLALLLDDRDREVGHRRRFSCRWMLSAARQFLHPLG